MLRVIAPKIARLIINGKEEKKKEVKAPVKAPVLKTATSNSRKVDAPTNQPANDRQRNVQGLTPKQQQAFSRARQEAGPGIARTGVKAVQTLADFGAHMAKNVGNPMNLVTAPAAGLEKMVGVRGPATAMQETNPFNLMKVPDAARMIRTGNPQTDAVADFAGVALASLVPVAPASGGVRAAKGLNPAARGMVDDFIAQGQTALNRSMAGRSVLPATNLPIKPAVRGLLPPPKSAGPPMSAPLPGAVPGKPRMFVAGADGVQPAALPEVPNFGRISKGAGPGYMPGKLDLPGAAPNRHVGDIPRVVKPPVPKGGDLIVPDAITPRPPKFKAEFPGMAGQLDNSFNAKAGVTGRLSDRVQGLTPQELAQARTNTITGRLPETRASSIADDVAAMPQTVSHGGRQVNPVTGEIIEQAVRPAAPVPAQGQVFTPSTSGNTLSNIFAQATGPERATLAQKIRGQRESWTDSNALIYDIEKSIYGRKLTDANDSFYKALALTKGVSEDVAVHSHRQVIQGIQKLYKSKVDLNDFREYLAAPHLLDVNAKKGEKATGVLTADIQARLATMRQKYTPKQLDLMEKTRVELVQLRRGLIDDLVDGGRISRAEGDKILSAWKDSVPMYRKGEDLNKMWSPDDFDMVGASKVVKELEGSERKMLDPVASILQDVIRVKRSVSFNQAYQNMAKLVERQGGKVDFEGRTVIRAVKPKAGEDITKQGYVVAYFDGKPKYFEVAPDVKRVLDHATGEEANMLTMFLGQGIPKLLEKGTNILRVGAIQNPKFGILNVMRDPTTAFINKGHLPGVTQARGLYHYLRKTDTYKDWIKSGGGYGNLVSADHKSMDKLIKQGLNGYGGKDLTIDITTGRGLLKAFRAFSEMSETSTKLGAFANLRKKGVSLREAAYQSRDLQDYARSGHLSQQANKYVAFLNANIQGKAKIYRSFIEDPAGVVGRLAVTAAIPAMASAVMWRSFASDYQKQRLADMNAHDKMNFWYLPVPNSDHLVRIAKPFDHRIPITAVENWIEQSVKDTPDAWDGFAKASWSNIALPFLVTAYTPWAEVKSNYSDFRARPIVPQHMQNLPLEEQFDPTTPEVAKGAAKLARPFVEGTKMELLGSPKGMEHFITGHTATLGQMAMRGVDNALMLAGKKDIPAPELYQLPLADAIFANPYAGGKTGERLYQERNKLEGIRNSQVQTLTPEQAARLKYLDSTLGEASQIRKEIRQIQSDPDITAQDKRTQIAQLRKATNETIWQAASKDPQAQALNMATSELTKHRIEEYAKSQGVNKAQLTQADQRRIAAEAQHELSARKSDQAKQEYLQGMGIDYWTKAEWEYWNENPAQYAGYQEAKKAMASHLKTNIKAPSKASAWEKSVHVQELNREAALIAKDLFYNTGSDAQGQQQQLLTSLGKDPDPLKDEQQIFIAAQYQNKVYKALAAEIPKATRGFDRAAAKMELMQMAYEIGKIAATDPQAARELAELIK